MAKILTPALCILLWAIALLNFASTSTPQTTISDHNHLPLSGFQQATTSPQPVIATANSRSQLTPAEFHQLSLDSEKDKEEDEKEKKEEEKERKKEEKERKKEEKEREKEEEEKKKKKKKDCSLATRSIKQSNIGFFCMISLALFFYF